MITGLKYLSFSLRFCLFEIFNFWRWRLWRSATFSSFGVFQNLFLENGSTEFHDFNIKMNLLKNDYVLSLLIFDWKLCSELFFVNLSDFTSFLDKLTYQGLLNNFGFYGISLSLFILELSQILMIEHSMAYFCWSPTGQHSPHFSPSRWTVTAHMISVFSLSWSTWSRVPINIEDYKNFMVMSELGDFTTLALQRQLIKTGDYYFEILTGWSPIFDHNFMVRSRVMSTKVNQIRIISLEVLLQGEIGRQRPSPTNLLIFNSSKRYSFYCRARISRHREKLKIVLRP